MNFSDGHLPGFATAEDTRAFLNRKKLLGGRNFNTITKDKLAVSTIGLGTGRFLPTNEPFIIREYAEVVRTALTGGINFLDCAINYGPETAERIVGLVLQQLVSEEKIKRSEIVICTKGGYLHQTFSEFAENYIDTGLCRPDDVCSEIHCIAPNFLRDQIKQSSENLQIETIDIYLLHNPEEQLAVLGWKKFIRRLQAAFEVLEEAVFRKQIKTFGISGAEGFRNNGAGFHPLDKIIRAANEVGGRDHHFKVIELPVNIVKTEALFEETYEIHGLRCSLLEMARIFDIDVIASSSLNGFRLPPVLPAPLIESCQGLSGVVEPALQFSRSAPGVALALFGTGKVKHLKEALKVLSVPRIKMLEEYISENKAMI